MAKKSKGAKFNGSAQPTGYAQVSANQGGKKKGEPGISNKNKC